MPLSAPAPREPIHFRSVECRGYRRDDGLWDIEGYLRDTKSYAFRNQHRGEMAPGEPVHEMWLRLTIDEEFLIHAVEAVMDASPFHLCPAITPNFQRLVGLRIGPGFKAKLRERLGRTEGCTHLVELIGPVATTAVQTILPLKDSKRPAAAPRQRPAILDTCHALASDSDVVRQIWPEFYTGT
jgi:hypothetical protein